MSRYQFELASETDDADLRHILASTPMAGAFAVAFQREPSFLAAEAVAGPFRQVVSARDRQSGRLVGFGCRSVRLRYVNGRPTSIGYLGGLRLLSEHRNRGLVARGYRYFRELHQDGRACLYLTTIAQDNQPARDLLTAGRAGLPAYHDAGAYLTALLTPRSHAGASRNGRPWSIRSARADDLPMIVEFVNTQGARRQFFPCYQAEDFSTGSGAFHGLHWQDLLLAFERNTLVGMLAGWDQSAFRQTVVHGYRWPLHWLKPVYNGWARCRGLPRWPAAGAPLRILTIALPVVKDDNLDLFADLVEHCRARAATGPWHCLALGLHENDPLLATLRRLPATWYITRLYLVCWEDGEALRHGLDGRVPYLELGAL